MLRNMAAAAYHNEPLEFADWKGVSYYIYGKEICPTTGREHLQFYVEFSSPKRISTIKKKFPKLHIEGRKEFATAQDNRKYCSKDKDFVESGEISHQGQRTDLDAICATIRNGTVSLDDILVQHPMLFHQYGRLFRASEDFFFRSVKRTTMTTCTWYVGPTGCGKSHKAYTENPDAYDYPYDGDWCDGYRGQSVFILNDFRGQIPYSTLLRLIDRWPMTVRVRNCQPRPFTSTHIIVTSCKLPEQIYYNLHAEDKIGQLLRRINIVNMKKRDRDPGV